MRSNFWLLLLLAATIDTSAQSSAGRVITSVPGDLNQHYEVVSGPCIKHRCPISVVLLAGEHVINRYKLEMESSSSDFEESKLEPGDGFGDPTLLLSESVGWRSGDEEDETVLSVNPFLFEPGLRGILIDERTGFEHVKRYHVLLMAKNNQLVKLWHGSEGAGPTSSTVVPTTISAGRESLLFYSFFDNPNANQPDKLILKSLAYDHASGSMVSYVQPLTTVGIGPFPTSAAARKERSSRGSCTNTLRVFSASAFTSNSKGYVLSAITSSADTASSLQRRLKSCKSGSKIFLIPMKRAGIDLW